MYDKPASDEELAALGLQRADLDEVVCVDVWPQNFDAVRVFEALSSQWRVGAGGASGLDYLVLPTILKLYGIKREQWRDIFDCIRVMEMEAMRAMRE